MSNPFLLLTEGTLLQDRYRVKRLIGKGGMGAVYEARAEHLGHAVALKQNFFGGEDQLKRAFEREARLLANLRHTALPRVTDYFAEDFGQFLVMEFIAGDDLMALLKQRGSAFPVEQVLIWADQILDTLHYLHTQEPPILHRDLKPQNLKLDSRGGIMLLDFGLAKGTTGGLTVLTASSSVLGFTPGYAPLEQMTGKGTDERSDLYALSATLYHLLTNQPPPDAILRSGEISIGDPDPLRPANELNTSISPELADLLLRGMAPRRNDRPQNAAEMRSALKRCASDGQVHDLHAIGATVESQRSTETGIDLSVAVSPLPKVEPRVELRAQEPPPLVVRPNYETRPLSHVPVVDDESTRERLRNPQPPFISQRYETTPIDREDARPSLRFNSPISFDFGRGVEVDFVPIPPGSFMMGGHKNWDEKPAHLVTISNPFYLGKYAVTQAQWQAIMGNNPSRFRDCDNCPVEQISWHDAQGFIQRLNGRQTQYLFRLPTEAEWEYAARAGMDGEPIGSVEESAWYKNNSGNKTHPVGEKIPNVWDLYDMLGNVFEWVQDWYDKDYYKKSPATDPTGPEMSESKVLRGGSWDNDALYCRSALRYSTAPGNRNNSIGVRLACDVLTY